MRDAEDREAVSALTKPYHHHKAGRQLDDGVKPTPRSPSPGFRSKCVLVFLQRAQDFAMKPYVSGSPRVLDLGSLVLQ